MAASRVANPWYSTHSRYHGPSEPENVTMAKRRPSMHAVSIAASASPTTGRGITSRAPPSPGSAKAATMAASHPAPCSAINSIVVRPAIAASARVAM